MAPPQAIDAVRAEVEQLLARSQAYQVLEPKAQQRLAEDMSKVGAYLADQGWLEAPPPARAAALAQEQDPIDTLKSRLAQKPGQVGDGFKAGAIREGVEQFGEMVKKVDFPKFVAGLVQGVFQAVVDASIQQMQAFSELLSATSKSVDQFAADHITDGQARSHVASRYPSAVQLEASGEGGARLRPVDGGPEVDLGKEFGLGDSVDLSDEESEAALVGAAKKELARSRQQMMATMVLMGINRIVVTDGHINAKVVFDMRASDEAARRAKAGLTDTEKSHFDVGGGFLGSIFGGINASHDHETTVSSSVDDTSESRASVKAQLTGDVRLAFKSETFPLERMVDVLGMQTLSQKSAPGPGARLAAPVPAVPAAAPAAGAPK